MKLFTSTVFASFAACLSFGAEIYVDANAAAGGDGSQSAPYRTIAEGVGAANLIAEATTVYVHGGANRVYTIANASDLVTVTAANMTVCAWGDYGKPRVELDAQLSATLGTDTPMVFTVAAGADGSAVRDFYFRLYGLYTLNNQNNKSRDGNTLGKTGNVVAVYANHVTVDGCEFHQTGMGYDSWGGDGVVASMAAEGTRNTVGRYMVVKDCVFNGIKRGNGSVRAIKSGSDCLIYHNFYTNSCGYFFPVKQAAGGYFCSNRVVNCSQSIVSNGGNYNEIGNCDVGYNIFVNSDVTFLKKVAQGMSSTPKIHHNTVIGSDKFIWLSGATITAKIFNNLVISPTGALLWDDVNIDSTAYTTGFKTGSTLKGNAYIVETFIGGSATESAKFDLAPLEQDNNRVLTLAPTFDNSSDMFDEAFYRLNSTRYPWVEEGTSGPDGTYPTYIGAVKPSSGALPGEFFQIDSFIHGDSDLHAPCALTFIVSYSQNAGPVTVSWDFEGNGSFEEASSATNITHVYQLGTYHPAVKVVDSATGTAVVASLPNPLSITLGDAYVDVNAPAGGNGSAEHPFQTIKEGVMNCDAHGTVHVRGGADRTYVFTDGSDLISFPRSGITVQPWNAGEKVSVVLDSGLGAATTDPVIFTVGLNIDDVTVRGLDFLYYMSGLNSNTGYSLGKNGSIVKTWGSRTTVDGCSFTVDGQRNNYGGDSPIRSAAEENNQAPGANLNVRNCLFNHTQQYAIQTGKNPVIECNVFTNCSSLVYSLKNADCDFTMVSNVFIGCRSFRSTTPSWNELPRAEIAYNIFCTENGTPFINKGVHGLSSDKVYIHHNTVIGGPLASVINGDSESNKLPGWRPQIFDNLVIADEGSSVIMEMSNNDFSSADYHSSFKTAGGASFKNNAYLAAGAVGGSATNLAGYCLSDGLAVSGNMVLSDVPKFISTEFGSSDFYRLKVFSMSDPFRVGGWTGDGGEYPAYIGAVDPMVVSTGTLILVR